MEKNNYPEHIEKVYEFLIPKGQEPERIDVYLTRNIRNATRNKIQESIDDQCITVNNAYPKANYKVKGGDFITAKLLKPPPIELVPEEIPLDVHFEDNFLMVVNKPAGMCTHPGFGNRYGTLANAVLYHLGVREAIKINFDNALESDEEEEEDLTQNEGEIFASDSVRPGMVHRLDKDTSGVLVIAKDSASHAFLANQFAEKTSERFYYAIIWGIPESNKGRVVGNIARAKNDRKLFTVSKSEGKYAATNYEVLEKFDYMCLVKLKLETGRTHQIRVHLKHIGHPVVGDKFYGGDSLLVGGNDPNFKRKAEKILKLANRQMLHAKVLGFTHPETLDRMYFESELPEDFKNILNILSEN